ncbi:DUF7000 family protein [Enterovibrio coralii]|uniref:DUF7000 family protein n=1 Tax=Enterovibrio coralii TaxID=294935 RepID=UPI000A4ABE99|nr:hypothetical protein [Enterovibrio coralii]
MSKPSGSELVSHYQSLLRDGSLQHTYAFLIKYVQSLKTAFTKAFGDDFAIGNVFQGYMDFTYFYLTTPDLKRHKLKLAVVFNHQTLGFELWLLGQTKPVQRDYWQKLQGAKWISSSHMPEYAIAEIVMIEKPDFDDLDALTEQIKSQFMEWQLRVWQAIESSSRSDKA